MTDISDELDVDVIQGLVLARDTLGEDVVDEPSQVDVLLVFLLLFLRFIEGLLLGLLRCPLLLCLGDDQVLDRLEVLLEVVLASVVALELDLVNDLLRRLLEGQVFDEVLESQSVLPVGLGLLYFLVVYSSQPIHFKKISKKEIPADTKTFGSPRK